MNLRFWIALLPIAIVVAILVWISFAHWKKAAISSRRLGLMIDGNYLTTLAALPLASIRVPTLVLHGTSDTIIPFASSKRTAAAIPEAQLVPIQNGSHFACLLGLGELNTEVRKFLEKTG